MVIMAHPAQYLIKTAGKKLLQLLVVAAVFSSCTNAEKHLALQAYNADSIKLLLKNDTVYNGEILFTGRLYKLSQKKDTLFVQDFDKGLKNGFSKFYYDDGKPAEIRYFVAGNKEGKALAWWPIGKKKFEYHYKNDLFEGLQQEWFTNGQLYSSKNFVNGYESGMQHNWDSSGSILSNYEAKNGRNYGNIGQKHCKTIFENDSFVVRN